IAEKAGDHFDLSRPIALATELREAAAALNVAAATAGASGDTAALERIDRAIFELTRLLVPVYFTESGPYEHDPAVPVPRRPALPPAPRLAGLDPGPDAYGFLQTKLVRGRNKVVHALAQAVRVAHAASG